MPGALVHVIARFVNGAFLMDDVPGAREEYLARLNAAVGGSDWRLCWYALMGSHTHLGLVSGEDELDDWVRKLHGGWAGWVNRQARRVDGRTRGPVFADRPMTVLIPDDRARYLGAYIHNNPVRARAVEQPEDSSWTSHRAYLGVEPAMPVLDVALGLSYYDCTPSRSGRQRFHEYVASRRRDGRDAELSGRNVEQVRRRRRAREGTATELQTPTWREGTARFPSYAPRGAHRVTPHLPTTGRFLDCLAGILGIGVDELRGSGRRERTRSEARRTAVLAWRMAGRRSAEICSALGISRPAASNLVRRAAPAEVARAARVLDEVIALARRGR